jgi:hypothetical protein
MVYLVYHFGVRLWMFQAYMVCKSAANRTQMLATSRLKTATLEDVARTIFGLETDCRLGL